MLNSCIYLQALFLRTQISGVEMQEPTLNIKKVVLFTIYIG